MKYLSVSLFVVFVLGIVCGKFLSLNFFFLIFLSAFLLLSALLSYKRHKLLLSDISILFLFFFLGSVWIKPYTIILPKDFLKDEVLVYGRIDSLPRYSGNLKTYSIGSNYVIKNKNKIYFPGFIFVRDYSSGKITYLDYYFFNGKLRKNRYLKSGYILYLRSNSPPLLAKSSFGIRKLASIASERITSLIKNNFPQAITPFILSIFLGKREGLRKEIKNIFANAGTSHILAISGLHIGIVSAIILLVLKMLGLKLRTRLIISIVLVICYVFICGLRSPVLRAGIMFICFSLSFLMRRKFLIFNSLALAGLINLLIRPADLFTASFQLSFVAVFFIALGFQYFFPKAKNVNFFENVKILFFMSVFANTGLMPLISLYFGKIYFLNIFTNILIIPYLGLIFSSLFVFIAIYIINPLRMLVSVSCSFLIALFFKINHLFSKIPFGYVEYKFSEAGVFLYYTLLFTLAFSARLFYLKRQARKMGSPTKFNPS